MTVSREDHHRALAMAIRQVPPDWKWPIRSPSHTWLHATEADLGPLNFGLSTAWRKTTTRDEWRHIVDTVMLQWSMLLKKMMTVSAPFHCCARCHTHSIKFTCCTNGTSYWWDHPSYVHRLCILWVAVKVEEAIPQEECRRDANLLNIGHSACRCVNHYCL